jgi:Neuraminidase (sialidase)
MSTTNYVRPQPFQKLAKFHEQQLVFLIYISQILKYYMFNEIENRTRVWRGHISEASHFNHLTIMTS